MSEALLLLSPLPLRPVVPAGTLQQAEAAALKNPLPLRQEVPAGTLQLAVVVATGAIATGAVVRLAEVVVALLLEVAADAPVPISVTVTYAVAQLIAE
jgi:hypothetical protein